MSMNHERSRPSNWLRKPWTWVALAVAAYAAGLARLPRLTWSGQ